MTSDPTTRTSKFISLVLRHKPEAAHVAFNAPNCIGVDELPRRQPH